MQNSGKISGNIELFLVSMDKKAGNTEY